LKVYKLMLEVETSLVVTEDQTTNVLRHSGNYISGSTIRGSIMTYLYKEKKNFDQEIKDPKLIFHPAYPIIDGNIAKPAHPLIFSCKLCDGKGSTFSQLSKEILVSREISRAVPIKCPNGHIFATKSKSGDLVIEKKEGDKKTIEGAKLNYTTMESVAINRKLGSVEIGMIYSYVALAPKTKFVGLIFDQEDRVNELDVENEFILYIGRGSSRGLGHVKAKLVEDKNFISNEIERVKNVMEKLDGIIILRAISPVFYVDIRNDVNVDNFIYSIIDVQLTPKGLSKYGLVDGENHLLTGIVKVSGFSTISNLPKISLNSARPGSLFFYKSSENLDYEDLVKYELSGFGPFSYSGFNILEVYEP